MADQPLDLMRKVNAFTHANNIAFVSVESHGVFSNIFCDFGTKFVVQDTNGEPPSSLMVASISQVNHTRIVFLPSIIVREYIHKSLAKLYLYTFYIIYYIY